MRNKTNPETETKLYLFLSLAKGKSKSDLLHPDFVALNKGEAQLCLCEI